MSADYLKEAEEASVRRPERAEAQPRHDNNGQEADSSSASRNAELLSDSRLRGRGNEPVRVALMQDMQQTHGNRAVQRFVQRSAAGTATSPDEEIGAKIKNTAGSGSSLDTSVQGKLESGLGADLSDVRVHTDSEADKMARSVDAVAFTTGNDIYFRDGAYNPGSRDGMQLLAHEATHTVQQSKGPVEGTPAAGGISLSDPSDKHEQEADRSAAAVMQGEQSAAQVTGGGSAGTGVQRQVDDFDGREEEQKKKPEDEEAAAVQAMRADRYASVQRAVASPGVEEEQGSAAAVAEQGTGPESESQNEANPELAEQVEAVTKNSDLAAIAALYTATEGGAVQAQAREEDKGRVEEQLEGDEGRVADRLKSQESSGYPAPSVSRTPGTTAAPTTSNSALRSVFQGSVVTAIKAAHDALSQEKPDAQAALNSIRQAEGVASSLRSIYKTMGEYMLEARLTALESNLNLRSLVLNDQVAAPVPLETIAAGLDQNTGVQEAMWGAVMHMHTPQQSNGPLPRASAPLNSALVAIMRGAIRDVDGVHDNLAGKTPNPKTASADLERSINVVRSLADTYRDAGDQFVAEKLAAVHNRLVWYKTALDDHDPDKRMTLKQIGESTDPEKEPFKERIKKIEDELR